MDVLTKRWTTFCDVLPLPAVVAASRRKRESKRKGPQFPGRVALAALERRTKWPYGYAAGHSRRMPAPTERITVDQHPIPGHERRPLPIVYEWRDKRWHGDVGAAVGHDWDEAVPDRVRLTWGESGEAIILASDADRIARKLAGLK